MLREIDEALQNAGEPSAAASWRDACRLLSGPLRVSVAARRIEAADRLARHLEEGGARTAVVGLGDEAAIGIEGAVLGSHVLLWPTPYTGALGAEERESLDQLEAAAPAHRYVVLTGHDLLSRVSDNPDAEAKEVRERVSTLLPDGWELLDEEQLPARLAELCHDLPALTQARYDSVARFLLADARSRAAHAIERLAADLSQTDGLLTAEETELERAQAQGRRVAAHALGAMRKETEALLIDLRDFLVSLEEDLPEQVAAVDDIAVVRRTLPHWLDHIIERWVGERLAEWRLAVLQDLDGIRLSDAETDAAELVAPALYAAPMRDESGWVHRIVVSAAVGGGAAMALIGLWIPAAVAVTGGLAWQTFARRGRESDTRARLIEQATGALREMGRDAERLLREQIDQIEAELSKLGDERAAAVAEARAGLRRELEERAAHQRARLSERERMRDDLAASTASLLE